MNLFPAALAPTLGGRLLQGKPRRPGTHQKKPCARGQASTRKALPPQHNWQGISSPPGTFHTTTNQQPPSGAGIPRRNAQPPGNHPR
eukprot:13323451-Ditylum_brightwellii.AAC.2